MRGGWSETDSANCCCRRPDAWFYLGGVFYAISLGIGGGIILIASSHPVVTAMRRGPTGERVSPLQWLGIVLGFGGVLAVVCPGWVANCLSWVLSRMPSPL